MKVRQVADALPPPGGLGMTAHLLAGRAPADAAVRHHDCNALADEPPRNAVAVGIDLDRAIGLHAANELAHLPKGRSAVEGLERPSLIALKAHKRHLAGGAVEAPVGDL